MSTTVSCTLAAAIGAADVDGAPAEIAAAAVGAELVVAAAVFVVVAAAGVLAAGFATCGRFTSSGNSRGASAAQPHKRPSEIKIARKIRFSMSRDGVPTSRIERVATSQPANAEPAAAQ